MEQPLALALGLGQDLFALALGVGLGALDQVFHLAPQRLDLAGEVLLHAARFFLLRARSLEVARDLLGAAVEELADSRHDEVAEDAEEEEQVEPEPDPAREAEEGRRFAALVGQRGQRDRGGESGAGDPGGAGRE